MFGDSMIRLLGFEDYHAFPGARHLTDSRIDTMIMLHNREGILPAFALSAARVLTDSQLENVIRLTRAGINENISIAAATEFTDIQIDTFLRLYADRPGAMNAVHLLQMGRDGYL